jgi:hypothetical protein
VCLSPGKADVSIAVNLPCFLPFPMGAGGATRGANGWGLDASLKSEMIYLASKSSHQFAVLENLQSVIGGVMYNSNSLMKEAMRLISAVLIALMLCVTASAYTVIMLGGRRVEIPAQFSVTKTTLTYDVAPDIQITLQIAAIDIAATERANNEAPGSLLSRVEVSAPVLSQLEKSKRDRTPGLRRSRARALGGGRTITNRDLEPYMRKRRDSEISYEKRRIELGLPSVEESRRGSAAEAEMIVQELEQKRSEETQSENYWRSRASELRAEIAAVDAEINYVRTRLDEAPFFPAFGSYAVTSNVLPFASVGRSVVNRALGVHFGQHGFPRANIFVAPGGPHLRPRFGFGGGTMRGRVFINTQTRLPARPFAIAPPFLSLSNLTAFGSPFEPYDFSYERSALATRFNELAGIKAGLNARWRELENEARRAGVSPGWLRP